LIAIIILSALVGIVIVGGKEVVVLGGLGVLMMIIVVISFIYTLVYINKLSTIVKTGESERYYVMFLILISMSVIGVNFDV